MPLISIIVPVYNVEAYLPQCIDSIRCQTFRDFEIVCVLDGSTDRSAALLSLYSQVEPRLRVIEKENGGLSSARNAGNEAANGEIVMFVDSDDMLTSDACKVVADTFEATGAEVVTFGAWCYPQFESTPWYDAVLSPKDAYYEAFCPDVLFKEQSHPFVWRTAVKAELLNRTRLRFDESVRFGEDQIFHFALYPKAEGVAFISQKLYKYRIARNDSLMASRFADKLLRLKEHIVISDCICCSWEADGLMEPYAGELLSWIAEFLFPDCLSASDEWRQIVLPKLREMLRKHFPMGVVQRIEDANPAKQVCVALLESPQDDDEIADSVRLSYLKALGMDENGTINDQPGWRKRLRSVAPISIAGLEWRLEQRCLNDEQLQWLAEESGACARSIELLRCELLAKSICN